MEPESSNSHSAMDSRRDKTGKIWISILIMAASLYSVPQDNRFKNFQICHLCRKTTLLTHELIHLTFTWKHYLCATKVGQVCFHLKRDCITYSIFRVTIDEVHYYIRLLLLPTHTTACQSLQVTHGIS